MTYVIAPPCTDVMDKTCMQAEFLPSVASNAAFFLLPLAGRPEPLGNPGGFAHVGPIAADSEFVAALPPGSGA